MREIKFRAWYEPRKWMLKVSGLFWDYRTGNELVEIDVIDRNDETNDIEFYINDVELMQFTGQKDREGTPIYDEDYVRVFWKDGSYSDKKVLWLNSAWRVTTFDLLNKDTGKQLLVIGNRFEGITRKNTFSHLEL